ncbi:MAG: histidine kinase [Kordiimonadaceae bacterium]|nr:histidine kinase [Kordiimonadaceae bacterium]
MVPNYLNPYKSAFYVWQTVIWAFYWVATRIVWLPYTAPPWEFNVASKATGFLFSTLLAFLFWAHRNKEFRTRILVGLILSATTGLLWRISYNAIDIHLIQQTLPVDLSVRHYFWHASIAVLQLLPWTIGYFLLTYHSKFVVQKERAQVAELQAKEAQLKLLHLQISPHFLFNVLNSLDTLLIKEDIKESRVMLGKLSSFLRQSLSNNPVETIPLLQEIERAKIYVDIETVRFQDRLTVTWDIAPDVESFRIPSLILQPLLENAIKHSVSQNIHGGTVAVSARKKSRFLLLTIKNQSRSDDEPLNEKTTGLGIGLENTERRLQATYGGKASLKAMIVGGRSFEVEISIELEWDKA